MALDEVVDGAVLKLKADLHWHTKDDPVDKDIIRYSTFEMIDRLHAKGINVFSITLHNKMHPPEEMKKIQDYAKKKGMIYIPGIERTIENAHVLIYNIHKEDAEKINTFIDLSRTILDYGIRGLRKNLFIVAAHPFFPSKQSIGNAFWRWHNLFHGLEYSAFYIKHSNFNRKAVLAAEIKDKVLVGGSDSHDFKRLGKTYSEIRMPSYALEFGKEYKPLKDIKEFKDYVKNCTDQEYDQLREKIVYYMKEGRVHVKTKPLDMPYFIRYSISTAKRLMMAAAKRFLQ
ncbi:MAG: PHP domain-containing protein [archaeon]